jgi:A/G-specific adenine glycosylase
MSFDALEHSSNDEWRFVQLIIEWGRENRRSFPWREGRTPYKVLLAEMLLQRTPANRVSRYFPMLITRFPEPRALALIDIDQLETILAPLGLRKRAEWIALVMRELCHKRKCRVPSQEAALTKLPGIGPYTARAVLCFGFGKDISVVDINVARVLSRVFLGCDVTRKPSGDKAMWEFAGRIIPKKFGPQYNESLLDHAALVCKKKPKCGICPIARMCKYFVLEESSRLDGLQAT